MAAIITRVDDLHNTEEGGRHVEARVTRVLGVDGAEFEIDLTDEHDTELMNFLERYRRAGKALGGQQKKKSVSDHSLNGSPLKEARRFRKGMRAFADSRPDLGEKAYLTPEGNYVYTNRLEKEYAEYVQVHGEYPAPDES